MKKIRLLALILLLFQSLKSQVVFCPPGAVWHYNFATSFFPHAISNETVNYSGDTIVGADTLKILKHLRFFLQCPVFTCGPTYIKQKGDTIFMKNNCSNGTWQILYNYACQPGQSWTNILQIMGQSTLTASHSFSVTSVYTVAINGYNLKRMDVLYSYQYGGTIVNTGVPFSITERLGSSAFLFSYVNKISTDCHFLWNNLCYHDNEFGTVQFTSYPCDFSDPIGLTEQIKNPSDMVIFPNPAYDQLEINLSDIDLLEQVTLYDLQGKRVELKPGEGNKINIQSLPPGLYFLELKTKTGSYPFRKKFIKE